MVTMSIGIAVSALFIGGLVAYRIRRNQKLAAVELGLIDLGNILMVGLDDENSFDRIWIYERVIKRLMNDGWI